LLLSFPSFVKRPRKNHPCLYQKIGLVEQPTAIRPDVPRHASVAKVEGLDQAEGLLVD
jgi:hypothetical protein